MKPAIILLILCGIASLAFLNRRSDLTIRVRKGEVTFKGRIAKGKQAQIQSFLKTLAAEGSFRVSYNYSRGGKKCSARISGDLSEGECQQIRNFLYSEL